MIDVKIDSSSYGVVSDILTYIITITNKSNLILEDVTIKSSLDEQLKFIINSVTIDNFKDEQANIISGINIGNIEPNSLKKVVFEVEIIKKTYEHIKIKFIGEYKYLAEDNERKYWDTFECEANELKIYNPNLKIELSSDSQTAQLNDEITYFIDIHNSGELDLMNLYLVNELPKNTKIIDGTFYINNMCVNSIDIDKGIILGNLKKNEQKRLSYKVKVISGIGGGKITNKVKVIYGFILNKNEKYYKESEICEISILMGISNFKLININDDFFVEGKNIHLESIDEIISDVKIETYKIIKTQRGKSIDGKSLNKYKLIINGVIDETVEYEVSTNLSTLKTSHYESQFSTYVVLPEDFVIGTNLEVEAQIENIDFYITGENTYFRSVGLLIIVKISKYK